MSGPEQYFGRRVRAKRLGWDDPPGGRLVTREDGTVVDLLDPPAWRDDGLPENVEGVLAFWDFPGSEYVKPGRRWSVDNEPVDPKTVVPVEHTRRRPAHRGRAAPRSKRPKKITKALRSKSRKKGKDHA
jgi:hypothetical protein